MCDSAPLLKRLRHVRVLIQRLLPVESREVERALTDEQSATSEEEQRARDAVRQIVHQKVSPNHSGEHADGQDG